MRFAAAFCLLVSLVGHAGAQPDQTDPALVAPDVVILVKEHQTGSEMVTVTMRRADYPASLLQEQVVRLGTALGSPPRGLYIKPYTVDESQKLSFIRASFATDNLIDRANGELNLAELVKAFLGAPEPHTIKSFLVTFEGEKPTENTLKTLTVGNVRVSANASEMPVGIEYRILSLTQNPDEVSIPKKVERKAEPKPSSATNNSGRAFVVPLLVIAGLAACALVYFAVRKGPRRG